MSLANELLDSLLETENRIVFAESCTGGAAAAAMTAVPGVSKVFCGSAVTYRSDTKSRWLGVDAETIENLTAVSPPVAHQMAKGALQQTPEATISISITGHLGPDAPAELDGVVIVGMARQVKGKVVVKVTQHKLESSGRAKRQSEAVELVLQTAIDALVSRRP